MGRVLFYRYGYAVGGPLVRQSAERLVKAIDWGCGLRVSQPCP